MNIILLWGEGEEENAKMIAERWSHPLSPLSTPTLRETPEGFHSVERPSISLLLAPLPPTFSPTFYDGLRNLQRVGNYAICLLTNEEDSQELISELESTSLPFVITKWRTYAAENLLRKWYENIHE